jgi:hypothetical protein
MSPFLTLAVIWGRSCRVSVSRSLSIYFKFNDREIWNKPTRISKKHETKKNRVDDVDAIEFGSRVRLCQQFEELRRAARAMILARRLKFSSM